jgi:RND family efflux transporter MFP subunit
MRETTRKFVTVIGIIFARLRFIAIFIIAALLVGYWDHIKNYYDRWTRPNVTPDSLAMIAAGEIEFYCPMHPEVIRSQAGLCPKCGMPLVKRNKGQAEQLPADVLARVTLTPKRKALAGIATTAVEYKTLVREIRSFAVLDYDETRLAHISARVSGRADELFVQYTGQSVKRGDPVYSLFSPEVYTAQRDYLRARKQVNDLARDAAEQAKMDATAFYNANLQKLVLWGISQPQLDKLDDDFDRTGKIANNLTVTSPISGIVIKKTISAGDYIQLGAEPYTVADLSKLWLQLKLYERDIPLVQVGDPVDVTVEAFPNQIFTGSVTFKSFAIDPNTRTLDARVEVDNQDLRLRPGMFADAIVHVPMSLALTGATTRPAATQPASAPASAPVSLSTIYSDALAPYLEAQKLLSHDKSDGVADLLQQSVNKLAPVKNLESVSASYPRLADSVKSIRNQPIDKIREQFKEISAAMIDIGKSAGTPSDSAAIRVFRCPMKKANWLQEGDATANPYYGSQMFDCGSAVESLPKATSDVMPTRPRGRAPAGKLLAVPRSAVIDTGRNKIVYVESAPGIFDMRAIKLGPLAAAHGATDDTSDDWYPITSGLEEGDRVVTGGTFLVDAENRLNPTRTHDHSAEGNP